MSSFTLVSNESYLNVICNLNVLIEQLQGISFYLHVVEVSFFVHLSLSVYLFVCLCLLACLSLSAFIWHII